MNIRVQSQPITDIKSDLLVIPLAQGAQKNATVQALDTALQGTLKDYIAQSGFTGKHGETLVFPTQKRLPSRTLFLLGMGNENLEADTWRRSAAKAQKEAKNHKAKHLAWFFAEEPSHEGLAAVVEGTLLSGYAFNKYKSDTNGKLDTVETLTLDGATLRKTNALNGVLEAAQKTAPGVCLARDLVNEPASVSTPSYLADHATKIARASGIKAEILGLSKIKTAKMAGLLAVAKGSTEEPRFIKLTYTPKGKPKKNIALVGKAVTFDSGGLSLKPPKSMETMKLDMSGGATVLGVMQVISQLKPQVQVTGYIPSTENMPSGTAQKPGDIIRYRNGKTVEVLNTDAEGRLILADALISAVEDKPDVIIDLATLTGACMAALGTQIAGMFCNNQELADALQACGKASGEALWPLPLVKEYKDEIKSSVADIKNIGGGYGGAITAALFLEEFVGEMPWAHLDIAGPAFAERDMPYTSKGGTGFGVRTLVRYVMSF
jgi:leucyl aminopeptidase